MKHQESDLQINCIRWFRYQYPAYARLMEHPKNEGTGDRVRGAIAKAEGVQPGVADLILHVPAVYTTQADSVSTTLVVSTATFFNSLAIEMKAKNGRQSEQQKEWQQFFEAAGGRYVLVRSFEEFTLLVSDYLDHVPADVHQRIKDVSTNIRLKADMQAKAQLKKITNPKNQSNNEKQNS